MCVPIHLSHPTKILPPLNSSSANILLNGNVDCFYKSPVGLKHCSPETNICIYMSPTGVCVCKISRADHVYIIQGFPKHGCVFVFFILIYWAPNIAIHSSYAVASPNRGELAGQ